MQQKKQLIPRHFWPFDLQDDFWDYHVEQQTGLSISEDKNHVYVEADVPGLHIDDIEVTFDKGTLWIKGSKKTEQEDKEKKYYQKASTNFSYCVSVPGYIDEKTEPEALYKDGVMKVIFTKKQSETPKKIKVKPK